MGLSMRRSINANMTSFYFLQRKSSSFYQKSLLLISCIRSLTRAACSPVSVGMREFFWPLTLLSWLTGKQKQGMDNWMSNYPQQFRASLFAAHLAYSRCCSRMFIWMWWATYYIIHLFCEVFFLVLPAYFIICMVPIVVLRVIEISQIKTFLAFCGLILVWYFPFSQTFC